MKTIVTLTRLYAKTLEIEIDNTLLEGMDDEEISTYLMEDYDYGDEDILFDKVEAEQIDFPDDNGYIDGVDSDRYDIYDDNDKQTYGGHL
mgnify:CR=1 FL=1